MLRNCVKIAIRNLGRQKGYSFINVSGLAIGMAACLLMELFVKQMRDGPSLAKAKGRQA